MFKELIKYLPELIILLMSLLYNIARMMSDLGGQFDALKVCDFVRNLDSHRVIDHASGRF